MIEYKNVKIFTDNIEQGALNKSMICKSQTCLGMSQ